MISPKNSRSTSTSFCVALQEDAVDWRVLGATTRALSLCQQVRVSRCGCLTRDVGELVHPAAKPM
jgi:hypothetical protein